MFDGGLTEPEIGRDARNPKPIRAFREMNGRYKFEVNGIPAIDLQNLYKAQGSEAQLVRYADAFNGFGEAMHECVAGNILFEEPLYGHLTQLVTLRASLPVLEGRTTTHPMFTMGELKRDDIPHWGLHSLESLTRESGYAPYDFWREALIIQGDEYVRTSLTEKKERLREQKEVELR